MKAHNSHWEYDQTFKQAVGNQLPGVLWTGGKDIVCNSHGCPLKQGKHIAQHDRVGLTAHVHWTVARPCHRFTHSATATHPTTTIVVV